MTTDLTGDKQHIVVLSDIHIADNTPTVWYQPAVHDPYLGGICDWVVANAASIHELVLLGDIVDFWTHPCDVQPPTFGQILAANPQIFGPTGFFGACLDALDGNVTYVPGNHDMWVTAADVAGVVSAGGHPMKYATDVYYPFGDDHRIALAHGHNYTMFNAPDPTAPWGNTPVGHFITRMVASEWQRKLAPGQTVADLPGQGSPDGLDYWSIAWGMFQRGDISVTTALLDSVAAQTGAPEGQTFVLVDGTITDLPTVHHLYADLFTRWAEHEGGGAIGNLIAWKSVLADARSYYMGWFAQRQAIQSGSDAIAFGHTHIPQLGLDTTVTAYANCGFESPSQPDMPPQAVTFAVIDTSTAGITVMQSADHGTTIEPIAVGPASVVPVGMDDSCYIKIINNGDTDLTLTATEATHGYFAAAPPPAIPAHTAGMIWLQDLPGPNGTEGTVTYTTPTRPLQFSFACPSTFWAANSCSGGTSFRTKSGTGTWGPPGHVATSGHPFYVEFTTS